MEAKSSVSGTPVRIGVSACLLGQAVRYDGTDRHVAWITSTLAQVAQLVPVCPEVEAGLGVPRERVNLVELVSGQVRVLGAESGRDVTEPLERFSQEWIDRHLGSGLCGMVLKSRSPSCGTGSARVVNREGEAVGRAWGVFAHAVRRRWPWMPVIEETQLEDPGLRRGFLARVFLLGRWSLVEKRPGELARFVQRESLLVAALCPRARPVLEHLWPSRAAVRLAPEELASWLHQAVQQPDCPTAHLQAWQWWLGRLDLCPEERECAWQLLQQSFSTGSSPWVTAPAVAARLRERLAPLADQSYLRPWPALLD